MDINKIKSDGFELKDHNDNLSDFAYLSLNIALKSYSATYQSFLKEEDGVISFLNTQKENRNYPHDYVLNASETIIHLHHFFELIIKEALRSDPNLVPNKKQLNYMNFEKAMKELYKFIDNGSIEVQFHF